MMNSWRDWFKVVCILVIIIVFFFGFLAGYFYVDKSCTEDPLVYGIEKINKFDNDDFTCSCFSTSGRYKTFSFDKEGFIR